MNVTIISGPRNSAKTTTLKNLISKNPNIKFLGYISESSTDKSKFYLRNVFTNEIIRLLQTEACPHEQKIGKYYILPNSYEKAKNTLLAQVEETNSDKVTIVLDEVGALELSGSGYHQLIESLIKENKDIIFCVRDIFVEEVCNKYNFLNIDLIKV